MDEAMNGGRVDAERLAALLEGRLQGAEREQLLEQIAASPGDYDDLIEATQLLQDLGAATGPAPAVDIAPRARARAFTPWLRAAVVVLIAGTATIVMLTTSRDGNPVRYADGLPTVVAYDIGLDRSPWAATRGDALVVTDAGRAVRIGARLTDLTLAIRSGDAAAASIAAEIAALLAERPGGAAAAAVFRRVAAAPTNATLAEAGDVLTDLPDQPLLELGAWVQAARSELAATGSLSDARDGVGIIDAALPALDASPDAARAGREARVLLTTREAAAEELAAALTELLAQAAR